MRIGIYFRTAHPVAAGLEAGFAGHEVHHREPTMYRGEVEGFDLVVVNGWRNGKRIAKAYEGAGIPVLVADFGYLKRVNAPDEYTQGYWQVGSGGLNKIPPFPCAPDRFDALGLEIVERGGDPNGYVLVCGQVPGDAALGQDSSTHREWLREQMAVYENAVYRPHPRGGIAIPGIVGNNQPLADALAGARLVVTYTSNVGHDALLAGVPVVAHGPAAYSELSGENLPSLEARKAYFNRVAYGQWTVDEMANSVAQNIWINGLQAKPVVPEAQPHPEGADYVEAVVEQRPNDADPGTQEDGQGLEPVATDYSGFKVPELRKLLVERNIAIPAGTKRAGLLALLV